MKVTLLITQKEENETRFNELGYNGPLGQKTIDDMIADTTIEGNK